MLKDRPFRGALSQDTGGVMASDVLRVGVPWHARIRRRNSEPCVTTNFLDFWLIASRWYNFPTPLCRVTRNTFILGNPRFKELGD